MSESGKEALTDCESLSEGDKTKQKDSVSIEERVCRAKPLNVYLSTEWRKEKDRNRTCGGKTEVFLFSTGGVIKLEDVEDGLRILFLF